VTECGITTLRKHDLVKSPNGSFLIVVERLEPGQDDLPPHKEGVLLQSTTTGVVMCLTQDGIDVLELRRV